MLTIAPPTAEFGFAALATSILTRPIAKPEHALAPAADASKTEISQIDRLLQWRAEHPGLFEFLRVEGMKQSPKVRENLQRLHRECKAQWKASAMRNPKLRATEQHIAAKEWVLRDPVGRVFRFRNLKKFIRENENLFDAADVQWKIPNGKANQAWCRAFHALTRLRPGCAKFLPEWQGWTWAGEAAVCQQALPKAA